MLRILLCIAFIAFKGSMLFAQTGQEKLGNWMMYFGMNKLNEKWSIHTEAQWRNHTVKPKIEQLLLRTGVNYHLSKNFMLTGGYGYISTHPFNKEVTDILSTEHRIWQQFIIKNKLSRIFFEHRYRYEQRWVNSDFRQRARYRLMLSVPLNKEVIEKGSFLFAVYDEVFLNLERGNAFDRNRLYAALGYQAASTTQIQIGFLNQTIPAFGKNYLQFAVLFNPDFSTGN